jgi:putative transport protein
VIDFLADEPLLLLFLVVGIGAAVGSVRIHGVSVGPAAALFAGLAVGAVDESLSGAAGLSLMREFGLVLFTYTVGVASGPSFFGALRRGGVPTVAVTFVLVGFLAVLTTAIAALFDISAADRAGVFAGASTNTPALQAAVEAVDAGDVGDPVVGYSLTYPVAVAAMIAVMTLLLGRRLPLPAALRPPAEPTAEPLVNWTVRITRDDLPRLGELRAAHPGLGFSRLEHAGTVAVARATDRPVAGDSLVVVGPRRVVTEFSARVGERSDHHLPLDRGSLDFRRIVVSNRQLAGQTIGHLRLQDRFGASITRLRRNDIDIGVSDSMRLALGDRVRVVGPPEALAAVAGELGDSERRLSEVDAAGFAIGIGLGLAAGRLAIPVPGANALHLGGGGGTLLVGLVLGLVSRIGPITFQLPHGANLVMRQFGVLIFLAAAGLGSGTTFADAAGTGEGMRLLAVGAIVATAFALLIPLVVEVVLRRDVVTTAGLFAGVETQPAALAYAVERTSGDERVDTAYALALPAAMIIKIVVAQLLA